MAFFMQGAIDASTRGNQRRGQSKDHAGKYGEGDGDDQNSAIEGDLDRARQLLWRKGYQSGNGKDSQSDAKRTSHQSQDKTFCEKLTQQAKPCCPQRAAYRKLA